MIPAPNDLTFIFTENLFYWQAPKNLQPELLLQNFTYVIYWSTHSDMSDASELELTNPPIALSLSHDVLYYVGVKTKDKDGYLSPMSNIKRAKLSKLKYFEQVISKEFLI